MRIITVFKKIISLGIIVLLVPVACTDNFDELNKNSSKITAEQIGEAELAASFSGALYKSVSFEIDWRFQIFQNLFADNYAQYYATSKLTFPSDRYQLPGRWVNAAWSTFYNTAAKDILPVLDVTKKTKNMVGYSVASILKVFIYIPATDTWGAIPYSSVGSGEEKISYDSQEVIYTDFFRTLRAAVADLVSHKGEKVFVSGDPVFGGKVDEWIKFANSLILRLALRVSDVSGFSVDGKSARQMAEEAVGLGVLEERAAYPASSNSQNMLNRINAWGGEFRMSAAMESVLKGFKDPRLPIFFSPSEMTGDYEGLTNGLLASEMGPANAFKHSLMGAIFKPENASNNDLIIMSGGETFFLRAEGKLKGWNMGAGSVQELYETGIRKSLSEWGVGSADIDKYINSEATPLAPKDFAQHPPVSDISVKYNSNRALEQIITQRWLAVFPNGFEGWSMFRRTGFPKLYLIHHSENSDIPTGTGFINRLTYPGDEVTNNSEGYTAGIKLLGTGGDKISTKLWWDH